MVFRSIFQLTNRFVIHIQFARLFDPMTRFVCVSVSLLGFIGAQQEELNVRLNNGIEMPKAAFAAQIWDAATCTNATSYALQAGFRFIWSSVLVGSSCQSAQGEVIQASGIARSELFVSGTVDTSGCSSLDSCYQSTLANANAQFEVLGLEQLDMLMLDYPAYSGCDAITGQWKAFEEIYAAGRARSIAVSNFSPEQMDCIVSNASATVPSVNMLYYSVGSAGTKIEDNAKYGVVLQAYSPLGGGRLVHDELCANIGKNYNKSGVQIALKWILQTNGTFATQSTNLGHLVDDMDIFDFTMTDDEVDQLSAHSSSAQMAAFV